MALVVRFKNGMKSGESQTLEDAIDTIVFGRDPEKCHVVFPAEETVVGREHFALSRVLGRYRLVLSRDHLVLVDGSRGFEDQELPSKAQVQLGADGPAIELERVENPKLQSTIRSMRLPPSVEFRSMGRRDRVEAKKNELILVPRAGEECYRRNVAQLVMEDGVGTLSGSQTNARFLVVPFDVVHPTFDDMLSVLVVQRRLEGLPVPKGLGAFARYAGLLGEGLHPAEMPIEDAPEAMFLTLRNWAGKDLTDPDVRTRFLRGWNRMARVIIEAAKRDADPFITPLFGGLEFKREQALLKKDREVFHQDEERGEAWRTDMPGAAAGAWGCYLKEPRSVLYRYWALETDEAPDGTQYQFVAASFGNGHWVCATDPAHRLSLQPLVAALQDREQSGDAERAEQDPWNLSRPYVHAIASPLEGSQLPDAAVLEVIKGWLGARDDHAGRSAASVKESLEGSPTGSYKRLISKRMEQQQEKRFPTRLVVAGILIVLTAVIAFVAFRSDGGKEREERDFFGRPVNPSE